MVLDKSKPKLNYPSGKPKTLKKMPDGNAYPYERTYDAVSGVQDDFVIDRRRAKVNYTPKPESHIGEDGLGGHR